MPSDTPDTPAPPAPHATPSRSDGFDTQCARAALPPHQPGLPNPVSVPVHRVSTIRFDSLAHRAAEERGTTAGLGRHSTYGTAGSDTTFALREAIEAIEGAGHPVKAALVSSGLAAITAALLAVLKPGDDIWLSDSVYGPTRAFADGMLRTFGIGVHYFDPGAGAELLEACGPRTRVIYLESPGSYTYEIQDLTAICAAARARGILTVLDNTWGSPGLLQPFACGIDVSVIALTKYWAGHADLLMGAIVCRPELWSAVWRTVRQLGHCVGGDDAWLVLRGLRTAPVRLRQHAQTALAVAHWLQTQPGVRAVLHPALPGDRWHARWAQYCHGSNGLLSVELDPATTPAQLAAFCDHRRHFQLGYSWGGFGSLIMPAELGMGRTVAPWTGGPLVRLHCGLEDAADLIADLHDGLQALARA